MMAAINELVFRREESVNKNGSVAGVLTIGEAEYPTIERGEGHVSARKGTYELKMDIKNTHRRIQCLRFNHLGMHTLLIHDAWKDSHHYLEGCIAPGMTSDAKGIHESGKAMEQILAALGGFEQGKLLKITIENNAPGVQGEKDDWLRARVAKKYW
jgi:hypothetical protein